jgi:hypothetical protein
MPQPLVMFALTTTDPAALNVSVAPSIAAGPLSTLHVTILLVAFNGITVPPNVNAVPTAPFTATPVTPVTG